MKYEEILRLGEKALTGLDAEALTNLYAPDFVLIDAPSGDRITEKNELRAYYEGLFSRPGISFTDVSFFGANERAAGRWTWNGINKSGEKFSIPGASIFLLSEDGIKEEILFYDPRPALG
jgi:hypothetical protein